MWHTISSMFQGVKPFDWLMLGIEVAVLIAIIYEIVVSHLRHSAQRKRVAYLAEAVKSLSDLMNKGQEVQWPLSDPCETGGTEAALRWAASAKIWSEEVSSLLTQYSSRALLTFQLISHDDLQGNLVFHANTGKKFLVAGDTRLTYRRLAAQLRNLRRIAEQPEVYF